MEDADEVHDQLVRTSARIAYGVRECPEADTGGFHSMEGVRTCGFPAYGLYGAFFVKGASRHFCRALLLHSFVRPAPRAFFHPDRTLPPPSRAVAVKDGASSAPPKACP